MVRSLYAGVTGMKAHQTRMDVIGNNIANVNTFGFKTSRATFRDVYYQSMRGAAGGTGTKGGLNPSQVGYGSTIGSIDVNQTQSINSSTGNPLDVSIAGEGFFQVQDADGNLYYTRAGILNIDDYGNLIDSNGSFVLGTSGSPVGKAPGSNRIQFTVPSVDPSPGSGSITVNGVKYTMKGSNATTDSNVTINLQYGDLPVGEKASAVVGSGAITVTLNKDEKFTSLSDLQSAINNAIVAGNKNEPHPAGTFSLSAEPAATWPAGGLTGEEICKADAGVKSGTVPIPSALEDLVTFVKTGSSFLGAGAATFKFEDVTAAANTTPHTYKFSVSVAGGGTYEGTITGDQMKSGAKELLLKNTAAGADPGDTITIKVPTEEALLNEGATPDANGDFLPDATGKYTFDKFTALPAADWITTALTTPSVKSNNLGMMSQPFKLVNGTEGGPQSVGDLSSIKIGADGVIRATHAILGDLEIGRIDLAVFDNPSGLEQCGNTYFAATDNSGDAKLKQPGTGGTGLLASSFLEMSNADLSQEFADMITTQRGFQANSRLITVSDTMLEELINLKR